MKKATTGTKHSKRNIFQTISLLWLDILGAFILLLKTLPRWKTRICSPQTITEFYQSTNETLSLSNLREKTKYWLMNTFRFHLNLQQHYSGFLLNLCVGFLKHFTIFNWFCSPKMPQLHHPGVGKFRSHLVILITYLETVKMEQFESNSSAVMFKLQYKSKSQDMEMQCIRDMAQNELVLHIDVCRQKELRVYCINAIFPSFKWFIQAISKPFCLHNVCLAIWTLTLFKLKCVLVRFMCME